MFSRGRHVATLFAAIALAGCESVFFGALNLGPRPDAVEIDASIDYGSGYGLLLDVYRPTAARGAPIVVFLHGGRWQGGSRAEYAFVGEALAARGIVAVVPDYREYPDFRFPAFVEDAARAVAWARANAASIGGDPHRVYVAGHSAGAQIAALVATDARYLGALGLRPRDLAGAVAISGPHDFLPITDADLADIFGPPERYPESQPVHFVDGDEPPFLLLHGLDDRLVEPRDSETLGRLLRDAGVPCELVLYPGVGHIRILAALDSSYRRLAPTLDDVVRYVGHTARLGAAP